MGAALKRPFRMGCDPVKSVPNNEGEMEMDFKELLKSLGIEEEKVEAIAKGMAENKIYLSAEEDIDARYGKLKGQHQEASDGLKEAQKLIDEMKAATADNEGLQAKVADYEKKAEEAEARAAKAERDAAIKVELLANGAVPEDVDYLMFRIEQSGAEIKRGEGGKLSGVDDAIEELKTSHPSQFRQDGGTGRFEGNRLPSSAGMNQGGITKEQFDKMGFAERNALYASDREAYNALAGKNEN